MSMVWCNGALIAQEKAAIAINDRGFTLADGIFETLLAIGRNPVWLEDHLARMRRSAEYLGLFIGHDDCEIEAGIAELLTDMPAAESAARITLTRGPTSQRGLWSSDNPGHPTLLITVAPAGKIPPSRLVICRTTRRNEFSPLANIKSLNYGDSILARRDAIQRDASDALMLNTQGHIACATVGNIFFRIGGQWITPKLSDGILPGLARSRIIPKIRAREQTLTEQDVARADAAFISNSLGCTAVASIEGTALSTDTLPDLAIYQ